MLDCLTERGQPFMARQTATLARCADFWACEFAETPTTSNSPVDAVFVRDQQVVGVAEVKVRRMSRETLEGLGSYLVTAQKLEDGRRLAAALRVGYVLIVDLHDYVVWWKVSDATGRLLVKHEVRDTATRATVNGGTALRANAFLDLDAAQFIPKETPA